MANHERDRRSVKKVVHMFLHFTLDSLRGYVRGLFPKTWVITHTSIESRNILTVSKKWLGTELKQEQYELAQFNPETARFYKENLPRIQKGIREYEERYGEIIVDKTGSNRI